MRESFLGREGDGHSKQRQIARAKTWQLTKAKNI